MLTADATSLPTTIVPFLDGFAPAAPDQQSEGASGSTENPEEGEAQLSPLGDRFEPSGEQPPDAETGSEKNAEDGSGSHDPAEGEAAAGADEPSATGQELTPEEQEQVEELAQRDREVRRHEQAHKAAAGPYARGGPTYEFQRGPDGRQYAVGGSVQIDTSPVPGDPQATIQKMQQVRRAAMAPAEPSSQDRAVAAKATQQAQKARAELQKQRSESAAGGVADGAPPSAGTEATGGTTNATATDPAGQPEPTENPLVAQFLGGQPQRGELIDTTA